MKKFSYCFLLLLFFAACNSTKHVPDGEFLLTKNHIYIDSSKVAGADLQKYILQKPNSTVLGVPIGLHIHNLGEYDKAKTPSEWAVQNPRSYKLVKKIFSEKQSIAYAKSFINLNNWFLSYPKPVLINPIKTKRTKETLEEYYKTQGYFKSEVTTEIKRDTTEKKSEVYYRINRGKPTLLDTINIKIQSPILDSIYKAENMKSLLKTGKQFKDQLFRDEAKNVVNLFRNNGVYYFNESALGFYVDIRRPDYKTNVDFLISENRFVEDEGTYKEKPYQVHKVKKVNVYTDYSFEKKELPFNDTIQYNGITFLAHDKVKYNPKFLSQSIFMKPNMVYKDTLRNLTRIHLKSLKNFKSTTINFSPHNNKSDELTMDVFLSPIEKYTLGFETELTHSNIREIGISGKFSITNRNTFRGAELLKLSALGTWFQSNTGPGYEIGADASLEIPRFVAPFGLNKLVPKRMSPKTMFSAGTSFQRNIGLDRQTFSFLTDYKWQYNPKKAIQLEILNLQYIRNLNVGRYFDIYRTEFQTLQDINTIYPGTTNPLPTDETQVASALDFMRTVAADGNFLASNPLEYSQNINILNRYNIITSDFLIPVIAYSYTYNNQVNIKDNNFTFFKARVANSGNFFGLFSNKENANGKKTVFGIPLAQYFKTDIEFKRFWNIGAKNSVFAFRTFLGAIFTYGDADVPFVKSYFAGGSNDIRAWQTYELGPGARREGLEFNTGSFKFLTSAEYRFDVVGRLKGALFVDAGNIWEITNTSTLPENEKLTGFSSLKNIAIGSGLGARVDFNFLILRFDVGFKTYEPYLENNRWFKNYNFGNAVYNVGINYPF